MNKKQAKKILLIKETLRRLEEKEAEQVKAGLPPTYSRNSCYNSCPPSCDC